MLFVMRKRWLAAGCLALVLSAAPATAALADTTITSSNESDDTETKTGDATATNSGAAQVGHQGDGSSDVSASDVSSAQATNVQEGDNDLEATQSANAQSGTAVGGQVIGAQVGGRLVIDATNLSNDAVVSSGDASAGNGFAAFVGLNAASSTTISGADVVNGSATNVQEGANDASVQQSSEAFTGDGVAGQIIGATSTGSTVITMANESDDVDAESGNAFQGSLSELFAGLLATGIIDV